MRALVLLSTLLCAPAYAVSFDEAVTIVIGIEGGYNPDDPSRFGITEKTLKQSDIPQKDVRRITPYQAQKIYRRMYWVPIQGDTLPDGIDLAVFDLSVQHGVARAVKVLQRVVGVDVDGRMGPETIQAIGSDCGILIDLHARRAMLYARLDHMERYHRSWFARMIRIHDLAMQACRNK